MFVAYCRNTKARAPDQWSRYWLQCISGGVLHVCFSRIAHIESASAQSIRKWVVWHYRCHIHTRHFQCYELQYLKGPLRLVLASRTYHTRSVCTGHHLQSTRTITYFLTNSSTLPALRSSYARCWRCWSSNTLLG